MRQQIIKIGKKVRNFQLERKKRIQIPVAMTTTLSSIAVETSFLDLEGKCFPLAPRIITDEKIVDCISSAVKSFEYFPETGVISILDKDLAALALNTNGMGTQICHSLGVEDVEGIKSLSRFADGKMLVLKRSGFSGVLHKFANGAFVSGSAISTFTTTAASHVSGVTGLPLIISTPGIIIFTPMVGGLFFGSLERVAAGTPFGMACGAARDVCLIFPRIAEVTLNHVFPGPLLKAVSIDAPINVTGYLRFGAGYEAVPEAVKKGIFATIVDKLHSRLHK